MLVCCFIIFWALFVSSVADVAFICIQAKAMAGDNTIRSLLEKMTQCTSNAYLGILERYILLSYPSHHYHNSFFLGVLKIFPHSAFRRFYFME